MSKTRDQINTFLSEIDVTDKTVLDVGAGRPVAWIFPPNKDNKVKGVPKEYVNCDYDDQWECNFKINLNKLYSPEFFALHGQFDYVFCMETLEHVWNPVQAIETLSKFTKEKLFISVPFVYPLHDIHDYLRYTFQWFEGVLPKYGFKQVHIKRRTSEDVHDFYKKEGMRMSKVTMAQGYGANIHDIGYCVTGVK